MFMQFKVSGVPEDMRFKLGVKMVTYTVTDGTGATDSCQQKIHVRGKPPKATLAVTQLY